jgi:glycosyltransferase involved in cell wall biosynthesis
MIEVIPAVCALNPKVQFLIGGDGPMMTNLEEMRERHSLHERVKFLGGITHSEVRNVLVQGDLFINFSLTEAFCMAALESVSWYDLTKCFLASQRSRAHRNLVSVAAVFSQCQHAWEECQKFYQIVLSSWQSLFPKI